MVQEAQPVKHRPQKPLPTLAAAKGRLCSTESLLGFYNGLTPGIWPLRQACGFESLFRSARGRPAENGVEIRADKRGCPVTKQYLCGPGGLSRSYVACFGTTNNLIKCGTVKTPENGGYW